MEGQEIIKLVYKLYLALPLIFTILFIGIGVYKFFTQEYEAIKYITNGAIGIVALIVGNITIDVLVQSSMLIPEIPALNIISSVLVEFAITALMLAVISRDDLKIVDRLYFLGAIPLFTYLINLIEKIFRYS